MRFKYLSSSQIITVKYNVIYLFSIYFLEFSKSFGDLSISPRYLSQPSLDLSQLCKHQTSPSTANRWPGPYFVTPIVSIPTV